MARELVLLAALRLNNEIGEFGYAEGERERDEDDHNAHEEGLQRTAVITDRLKHGCSLFHLVCARLLPSPALALSLSLLRHPIYVFPLALALSAIMNTQITIICAFARFYLRH